MEHSLGAGAGTGTVKNGAVPAPKKEIMTNYQTRNNTVIALLGQDIVYANTN